MLGLHDAGNVEDRPTRDVPCDEPVEPLACRRLGELGFELAAKRSVVVTELERGAPVVVGEVGPADALAEASPENFGSRAPISTGTPSLER